MGDTSRHLTYFKVENFKRFESFEMKDLGQFNLIVGDNNVGKTSVLEALLCDNDRYIFINNLFAALDFRNLRQGKSYRDIELYSNRELNINKNKFDISFQGQTLESQIDIKIEVDRLRQSFSFSSSMAEKAEFFFHDNVFYNPNFKVPFIPFSKGYDEDLSQFYSRLQQNRTLKNYFIKSLKALIPNIDNIELSSLYPNDPPHLIIYQSHLDSTLPLALFGDGAIKLFRILSEIIISKGKRLMIDEIDTGIHYSHFVEFWKTILSAAKQYDVQLFMTTHNEECIKYFVEALEESEMKLLQKDVRNISLVELPDKSVNASTYNFEQLEANIQLGNEVRGGGR